MSAKNQLLALMEKSKRELAEATLATKKEYAKLLGDVAAFVDGLDVTVIHTFNIEPAVEPYLQKLGLVPVMRVKEEDLLLPDEAPVKRKGRGKAKVAKKSEGKRGKRGETGGKILAAIGTGGKTASQIAGAIKYEGANIHAVLAGMAKAKKIKRAGKEWFKV